MFLFEYALMDFGDTWIPWLGLGYNVYQVVDNRDVQEFGVKGHLGVIWGNCSNMLKTLRRLHNSTDFDLT